MKHQWKRVEPGHYREKHGSYEAKGAKTRWTLYKGGEVLEKDLFSFDLCKRKAWADYGLDSIVRHGRVRRADQNVAAPPPPPPSKPRAGASDKTLEELRLALSEHQMSAAQLSASIYKHAQATDKLVEEIRRLRKEIK